MDILDLLIFMRQSGASDLHLHPFSRPIVRVDGEIRKTDIPPMLPEDLHILIYGIMTEVQRKTFEEDMELDFAADFKGIGRFRVNVFKSIHGDAAVLRAINEKVFSFEDLGLPVGLKDMAHKDKGLFLVTGPTGSGKSTTLNTIIDYINRTKKKHIITIEDPVEFTHTSQLSLITQREVGTTTHGYAQALRAALREDPDVIVVGEMRDPETTALAVTAAETGHLVFGTLHTVNTTKTLDRVIDQFPANQQDQIRIMISDTIVTILSQMLLKKKGGGRVAAFEVLTGTPAVANLIREAKTFQLRSILQMGSAQGMMTLEQSLGALVKDGHVDLEAAMQVAAFPEDLEKLVAS
ncbi:MAG: type IV pilus twitching motility protein PilT [FCB group bacterium]|nr:type IV pilus twitching motility protein PilT [FCB group bacterium]MBL7029472.1 type IV pilus twitching motility protein PilT [Candidatus Neomarinimicrobiota bacterium]MBL7123079.1 type IV pilus twitching motility protein PilT [Candidatus Neomarinimicrobiota bacterium]